jgi:transcriptional regulator with XRE-family HTH domain
MTERPVPAARIEADKGKRPGVGVLQRLAKALGVPVTALVE